jgi:hypothetical protein
MEIGPDKIICARSKLGDSLSQISQLTGLTKGQVKQVLAKAADLTKKELSTILHMKLRGLSLEHISRKTHVPLEVLDQFLPQETCRTLVPVSSESRSNPSRTEELNKSAQSKPQHIYWLQTSTGQLHRTNLLTGEQSCYQVRSRKLNHHCRLSELPGGSLLCTGGYYSVREVVKIETLREWAVSLQAPMHTARYYHAAVYHSQYLYVLGGYNNSYLRECERYVCAERRWEVLPGLPLAYQDISAVEFDNSLYAIGGNDDQICVCTVQMLSLDSLTWELLQFKLPQICDDVLCLKTDSQVYLLINKTLYSFTPAQVTPIRTLLKGISYCDSSYYSRGTLYNASGRFGIETLDVGELA